MHGLVNENNAGEVRWSADLIGCGKDGRQRGGPAHVLQHTAPGTRQRTSLARAQMRPLQYVTGDTRRGTVIRSIWPSNSARTCVRLASYPNEIRRSKCPVE